jgi:hypothetical protein
MSKLDAALALATYGVKVHPVSPETKAPLTKHGHLDGSTNPEAIRAWWGMWPDAWPGMNLAASGLVDVAPDSPEWLTAFEGRGLETPARWQSPGGAGHVHTIFRRPAGCPTTRICRSGEYDVMSDGYSIAYLSDAASVPNMNGGLPEAPAWVVDMLRAHAAEKAQKATKQAEPTTDTADEPPIELDDRALAVWAGEVVKKKPDGTTDRSASLVKVARVLYDGGMTRRGVVAELRERDHQLGFHKFCCDRSDAETRYQSIFDELEAKGRNASGYLVLDGTTLAGSRGQNGHADEAGADGCTRCADLAHQLHSCRREAQRVITGVRKVLKDQNLTPGERLAAIAIGFTATAHAPQVQAKATAAAARAAELAEIARTTGSGEAKNKAEKAEREAAKWAARAEAGEFEAFGPALAAEAGLPRRTFDTSAKKLAARGLITKRAVPVQQMRAGGPVPAGEFKYQLVIGMPGATVVEKFATIVTAPKEERAKPGGWQPRRCPECPTAAIMAQTSYFCAGCGQVTDRSEAKIALKAIMPDATDVPAALDGQNGHVTTSVLDGQNGHADADAAEGVIPDGQNGNPGEPARPVRYKDVRDDRRGPLRDCLICGTPTTTPVCSDPRHDAMVSVLTDIGERVPRKPPGAGVRGSEPDERPAGEVSSE